MASGSIDRILKTVLVCLLAASASRAADHFVTYNDDVNTHLIPCYGWTCGCSPTASAMVLGYWDNLGSMGGGTTGKYPHWGNLIQYYIDQPALETYLGFNSVPYVWLDAIMSRPRLIEELAEAMHTDGGAGSTGWAMVSQGINSVAAQRGYGNGWAVRAIGTAPSWLLPELKAEIDNNRPCVWSTSGALDSHSTCAWGYTDDNYVILYNTWDDLRQDWFYAWYLGESVDPVDWAEIVSVTPKMGTVGDDLILRYPDGDEVITMAPVTLWWDQIGSNITNVDIDYSTDGGLHWTAVAASQSSLEGLNYYLWNSPPVVSASRARVRISGYRDAGRTTAVAADGSKVNFNLSLLKVVTPVCPYGNNLQVTSDAAAPIALSAMAAAAANDKIYCFANWSFTYEFNPATGLWTAKANMPRNRAYFAASAVNNVIYLVGGRDGSGTLVPEVDAYDPSSNTWNASTPANLPTSRQQLTAASLDGILYAVGGIGAGPTTLNTVEAYDPNTNTWSTKTGLNLGRYDAASASLAGNLYVFGGVANSIVQQSAEKYDSVLNAWSPIPDMPSWRQGPSATAINDTIYLFGGYSGGFLGTVAAYDLNVADWKSFGALLTPRLNCASDYANGAMHVVGGRDGSGWLAVNEKVDIVCASAPSAPVVKTYVIPPTPTFTPTPTLSPTPTFTFTRTFTKTFTPTFTRTFTCTSTPTFTRTFTRTSTPTPSPTNTATFTDTFTQTLTRTFTPTSTPTFTRTVTPTPTSTFSPTNTSTWTLTPTVTCTPTRTLTPTTTPTPPAGHYVYPQPAFDHVTFLFADTVAEKVDLFVYNLKGVNVAHLTGSAISADRNRIFLPLQGFAPGVYFYTLRGNSSGLIGKGKFMVGRP